MTINTLHFIAFTLSFEYHPKTFPITTEDKYVIYEKT